jgi:hypothetical protein
MPRCTCRDHHREHSPSKVPYPDTILCYWTVL